jgi:hypothetical protein
MLTTKKKNLRLAYREIREFIPRRVEINSEVTIKQTADGDVEVPTGGEVQAEISGLF